VSFQDASYDVTVSATEKKCRVLIGAGKPTEVELRMDAEQLRMFIAELRRAELMLASGEAK
jgi:hypothetical protein